MVWGDTVFPALMRLRQVYLQVKASLRHRTENSFKFWSERKKGRRERGKKETEPFS